MATMWACATRPTWERSNVWKRESCGRPQLWYLVHGFQKLPHMQSHIRRRISGFIFAIPRNGASIDGGLWRTTRKFPDCLIHQDIYGVKFLKCTLTALLSRP